MSTQRVPILMYHRVGAVNNDWERKYCVGARQFASHMHALADAGWQAAAIGDFFSWLDQGAALPQKTFLLTFDDGFLGVHEHAAPVLAELRWPATVFLVSGLLGKTDEWTATQNPDGATHPLMNAGHIGELSKQRFSFQSHTRTHADLTMLDDGSLRDQLTGSRIDLEALLGMPVECLAYPFGRYDDRVLAAAKAAGYRAAFSVQPGFNRRDVDRFRLRRLDVFGGDSAAALKRKTLLGSNDGRLRTIARYGVDRLVSRLQSGRN